MFLLSSGSKRADQSSGKERKTNHTGVMNCLGQRKEGRTGGRWDGQTDGQMVRLLGSDPNSCSSHL